MNCWPLFPVLNRFYLHQAGFLFFPIVCFIPEMSMTSAKEPLNVTGNAQKTTTAHKRNRERKKKCL